jgi:Dyp-type peroxidase family
MPLHEQNEPIQNPDDWQTELEGIQGNILKSHGRHHVAHIFFEFSGESWQQTRACIAAFSVQVTSAWDHILQSRAEDRDSVFRGLCLTHAGYEYLRVPVDGFLPPFGTGLRSFLQSQNMATSDLEWERHFRAPHMLVIVAHRDACEARKACIAAMAHFSGCASATVEWGSAETNKGQVIEHFGFADGISQPQFFTPVTQGRYNGGAGPKLVLRAETVGGIVDVGSYFVYWRLRQDVAGFNAEIAALANHLNVPPDLAEAWIVGRFKDGTPVEEYPARGNGPVNDFDYANGRGYCCPVTAHIRKVNPRGTSQTPITEPDNRIARRGITYTNPANGEDKGLLFQCCQAYIEHQFQFIVKSWMRSASFPAHGSGTDRLMGPNVEQHQWPTAWGVPPTPAKDRRFPEFIRSRGGAYFFIPGKPFLRQLPTVPPSH